MSRTSSAPLIERAAEPHALVSVPCSGTLSGCSLFCSFSRIHGCRTHHRYASRLRPALSLDRCGTSCRIVHSAPKLLVCLGTSRLPTSSCRSPRRQSSCATTQSRLLRIHPVLHGLS